MHVKINWNSAYSVNHSGIDKQHQGLFELIDGIPDTLDSAIIKRCLMKLFKYTRTHFSDEENIMKNIGYPGLEDHQKQHDILISKLGEFSDYEFSNDNALADFKEFAYDWIVDHIMDQDMNYYYFAKENNLPW